MKVHEVERTFTRKLGADKNSSGDHIYFYFDYEGSEYTVGKMSHSWKGILNDTQIMMLARKLFLKKGEFEQFVDCSLTTSEAVKLWQDRRPEY